ncbi:extracellular solute-binding protein [bacterium]|nr:extracellular solute-binding protein [bacterium]
MSRRVSSVLMASALTLVLSVAGCDRQTSRTTLTLWHAWGGVELAGLKETLSSFRDAHPEVEVVALQVPSDKLQDKYLRSTAANGGPDLVLGATDWVGKFAQSEVILPLDQVVSSRDLSRYLPVALDALRYEGRLYALPESLETLALYYNKRLVTGAPPTTVQDLFTLANSRDYWQGDYLLAYNTQFFFTAGYLFGMGGGLFGPKGDVSLAGPGAEHWLGLLRDLKRHPRIAAKSDYGRADGLFRDGKAAMTINGPWALGGYRQVLGDALGVAPLPMVEEGVPAVPFVGVKCVMFNPNSHQKQRAHALELALALTGAEAAERMQRVAGHIPAQRGVKIPAGDRLEAFAQQARWGTPLPPSPEMKEVWAPMDEAIEKVLTDVAQPPRALAEAREVISAKIEAVRKQ